MHDKYMAFKINLFYFHNMKKFKLFSSHNHLLSQPLKIFTLCSHFSSFLTPAQIARELLESSYSIKKSDSLLHSFRYNWLQAHHHTSKPSSTRTFFLQYDPLSQKPYWLKIIMLSLFYVFFLPEVLCSPNPMNRIGIILYGSCFQYIEFCTTHHLNICYEQFFKGILPFSAPMFLLITLFPGPK